MIRTLLLAVVVAGAGSLAAAQEPKPATPAAKPDLEKAQATARTVCAACHGPDGNSPSPAYPNLASMPAEYITLQLAHFKAGIRVNPIMQGIAASLSDDDMTALGLYFARQPPRGLAATDKALVQAGAKLYRGGDAATALPACAACHAPNGTGIPKNYPRLAGQHGEYTLAQLKAFKAGERGNDKAGKDLNGRIMGAIAAKLSEADMQALAQFTQGLR